MAKALLNMAWENLKNNAIRLYQSAYNAIRNTMLTAARSVSCASGQLPNGNAWSFSHEENCTRLRPRGQNTCKWSSQRSKMPGQIKAELTEQESDGNNGIPLATILMVAAMMACLDPTTHLTLKQLRRRSVMRSNKKCNMRSVATDEQLARH